MRTMRFFSVFLLLALALPAFAESPLLVNVRDALSGEPISGANILVGLAPGNPFADNARVTGADGKAEFTAEYLRANPSVTITAAKAGYSTLSVVDISGQTVELSLQRQPPEDAYAFIQGEVSGWPTGYGRKTLEVGVFMPALRPQSLLSFEMQQIISSYSATIEAGGTRDIPANIVFPEQTKSYFLVPIHLNKPQYIMPLAKSVKAPMSAMVGAVPVGTAVNGIRADDYLFIMNNITLTHVEWTDPIEMVADQKADIRVSKPLQNMALQVRHPKAPAKMDAISVGVYDYDGTGAYYIPLDVKSLTPANISAGIGAVNLARLKDPQSLARTYVFSAYFDSSKYMDKDPNRRLSRALTALIRPVGADGKTVVNDKLLSLMQPKLGDSSSRRFEFSSPNNSDVAADLLVLNIYSQSESTLTKGKIKKLLWTSLLNPKQTKMELPRLDNKALLPAPDAGKKEIFYWEVIALKSRAAIQRARFRIDAIANELEYISSIAEQF